MMLLNLFNYKIIYYKIQFYYYQYVSYRGQHSINHQLKLTDNRLNARQNIYIFIIFVNINF